MLLMGAEESDFLISELSTEVYIHEIEHSEKLRWN